MPHITNEMFLDAIFGSASGQAHVTGFTEDPGDVTNRGKWAGWRWGASRRGLAGTNSYFTISLFRDDPNDARRPAKRRKDLFRGTYVIVVDDVGTKVTDTSKLPEPTYRLETSPGNEQWGYVLDMPEVDPARVDALLDGMVALGLCADGKDPGMKGVTRYVRLPEGKNTKAKYGAGGFACVMRTWNPGVRYTLDDLATPWGIVLPVSGAGAGSSAPRAPGMIQDPHTDVVFTWLLEWGEVSETLRTGDGGYRLDCPFSAGHTVQDEDTGAYYPGSRGYVCHHGHCRGSRERRDFVKWAEARKSEELGKTVSADFPEVHEEEILKLAPQPAVGTWAGVNDLQSLMANFVYILPEGKFYSTRSGRTIDVAAINLTMNSPLMAGGGLPSAVSGRGYMSPAEAYMDQLGTRRIAEQRTFWPGRDRFFTDEGLPTVNTWVAPPRWDSPFPVRDIDVEPWLALVRHIVGVEGPAAIELVLDWMALVVGEPGAKPGWHIVVQSRQGLGKDLILWPLKRGVGDAAYGTVNAAGLSSDFNPWAEKRLVIVNELRENTKGAQTGADQYNKLKELTSTSSGLIKINQKHVPEYYAHDVSAFFITSNEEKAVALEIDDRRFFVIGAAKVSKWTDAQYKTLADWLNAGGALMCAEWLHERMASMSASRRDALVGNAPMTAGKGTMIANNTPEATKWFQDQIEDWPALMTMDDIRSRVRAARNMGALSHDLSDHRIGGILAGLGAEKTYGGNQVRMPNGVRTRVWAIRDVAKYVGAGGAEIVSLIGEAMVSDFADDDVKVVKITKTKKVSQLPSETDLESETKTH
jgi:hypothetical protein